jgi:hypothetical protein
MVLFSSSFSSPLRHQMIHPDPPPSKPFDGTVQNAQSTETGVNNNFLPMWLDNGQNLRPYFRGDH